MLTYSLLQWTRLIGGTSAQKKRSSQNDPQQRLARFKRVYNQILNTWHKSSSLAGDPAALDSLRASFQRLTSILNEESRSPAPHLCLQFASSSQIYSAISRIASTSHNEALVRDAVAVFGALIDSEEEDFLANDRFAEALMTFVSKISSSNMLLIGEDTDAEIVELLFGISAKIRLEPEILPVWFSSTGKVDSDTRSAILNKVGFAGIIRKEDFPLCYQLIDHVHHEGRIGDFARTGLLYIFETASKSRELEQWIVESDLATLMASGLGALYSQLSRKLSVLHPPEDRPVILTLSDYPEYHLPNDAESIFSPGFRTHLDTFLSYLAFWQDVLEHCRSPDVRQTLIDHFQVLFLQQLLYPSLLESSDVDGGSSVAVLNYLRQILDALDHHELVYMILRYLLALPDENAGRQRSASVSQRRSTLMLLSRPEEDETMNPSLFNLVDLLLNSTQSRNQQTVVSALKLVTTILGKNHKYATGTLVRVTEVHHKDPQRTMGALNAEIESYLDVAEKLVPGSSLNAEYDSFLKDVMSLLESHPCSMKMLALHGLNLPSQVAVDYLASEARKDEPMYRLNSDDALFMSLMKILSNFFTNTVDTNLSLTDAIVNLASCPNMRLEGWLAVEPTKYHFDPNETFEDEDEDLRDILKARRKPSWTKPATPALLAQLKRLMEQVESLRKEIPDFDGYVATRKQAFRMHEEINEALRSTANFPPPSPYPMPRRASETPPPAAGFLTPQFGKQVLEGAASPFRSQSPRGRKLTSAADGRPPPFKLTTAPWLEPAPSSKKTSSSSSMSPDASRGASPNPGGSRTVPHIRAPSLGTILKQVPMDAEVLKRPVKFPAKAKPRPKKPGRSAEPGEPKIQEEREEEAEAEAEADQNDNASAAGAGKSVDAAAAAAAAAEPPKPNKTEGDVEGDNDNTEETKQGPEEEEEIVKEVSLGHVLTNVVILQQFVLELVAILQVRASLFQEVKFV
ncbi:Retinoic acid induced 16-like protein-domain-containing protein [Phyllosticta citricarpa]|uniref:Retinoic acid induced 16-like protein-domain-containing protein n=2 Tax=Phyllosticta TaxID=121621 RepID=A0ABR1MFG2_9PEZI